MLFRSRKRCRLRLAHHRNFLLRNTSYIKTREQSRVFLYDAKVKLMEMIGALIAGSAIGAVLGFIGAGGAMVSVPILTNFFHFSIHQATVAALIIVFGAALSGLYGRWRRNEVLAKEALTISAIGLITNVTGARIADQLSEKSIKIGFAAILVLAGFSMIRKHNYRTKKSIS